jgi:Zn-dependent protease with chaperone function
LGGYAAAVIVPFLPHFGGVSATQAICSAPAVMLLLYVAALLRTPLLLLMSRRGERLAHRSALEMTGDPRSFISAMGKIARGNLAAGRAGLVDKLLTQSHPTLDEVVQQARTCAAAHGISLEQSPGH